MTHLCSISGNPTEESQLRSLLDVQDAFFDFIKKSYPDIQRDSKVSVMQLNLLRQSYLKKMVVEEYGAFGQLHEEVIKAMTENKILSENIEPDLEEPLTLGQRMADNIASFGGSWAFILSFFAFLLGWIAVNVYLFTVNQAFDPYPFILLNLILSCLAAIQAPIIMMSQNRLEEKDRRRGEHDFKVNLKAELEIRLLNEKLDHVLHHQHRKLLEIQQLQADYLQDIVDLVSNANAKKE